MNQLPIHPFESEIVDAIRNHPFLVIVGETGSGKTTQIPQFLRRHLEQEFKCVAISQPRRVAAISVAHRVAEELKTELGGSEVGYKIRFEECSLKSTRLQFMTDGILLRECLMDPMLSAYDAIILDEAHERSLETDILFGLLKKTHGIRPGLRVIIMSATLNVEKFCRFFDDCPVFQIPGRLYDVEILHQREGNITSLKGTFVKKVLHIHKNEEPGDVLVFLTGQQEIEDACKILAQLDEKLDYDQDVVHSSSVKGLDIHPLYAALDTHEQRHVFKQSPKGLRKVVFSTNIAATSVTIDGIRYVVDPGFVKQKMYDPTIHMDALIVVPVSKSAADQRAGRAGRTSHGKVYRLYKSADYQQMADETEPEICRTSLTSTVLQLKKMGINNIVDFPFMDAPDRALLLSAAQELYFLEALDKQGNITEIGKTMTQFPLSPHLSCALIASARSFSCSKEVVKIVSVLSSPDIYSHPRRKDQIPLAIEAHEAWRHHSGDHLTVLNLYQAFSRIPEAEARNWCRKNFLNCRALAHAKVVERQLVSIMERNSIPVVACKASKRGVDYVSVIKSFLAAFYLNVAKRHSSRSTFYHYVSTANNSPFCLKPTGVHDHAETHIEHQTGYETNPYLLALSVDPHSSVISRPSENEATFLDDDVDWIVYHELVYSQRAFMKICSKINIDWIDQIEKRTLLEARKSGNFVGEELISDFRHTTPVPDAKQISSSATIEDTPDRDEGERSENIDAARLRYLERKRLRESEAHSVSTKKRQK